MESIHCFVEMGGGEETVFGARSDGATEYKLLFYHRPGTIRNSHCSGVVAQELLSSLPHL